VFPKGAIVRACFCALGVEPWVCPYANKWFSFCDRNFLEGMSRWFPSKTKIQKWIEGQEKEFTEAQNKNPNLSSEDWLEKYIFTDIHEIFFLGIHQELYEWLARLVDTQFEIRSRPPMDWISELIKKVKTVDRTISRAIDHYFDSTIGGYITGFDFDIIESYNQAKRYFFKGPRGKKIHFLKLRIKMLLYEKNILKIE
jgi:hypothetical protein